MPATKSRTTLRNESSDRLRARINAWRKRTNQTNNQLVADLGMPEGTLNQMLYGTAWGFCWHNVLAKKLGTTPDQIWAGAPRRCITPKRGKAGK